ncbi:MAG: cytochrome C assembly protein [SAR202 cluster bacterium]|nr:cytochrome C assembly protein [SAR202 cluster bacterium]
MSQSSPATTIDAVPRGRFSPVRDGLFIASAVCMAVLLYLVFFVVPTDANLGVSQRILYFHAPVAILSMVSIVVVAVASGAHLITRSAKWDSFAYASAEIGIILASLTIIVGAIWAKPVWGVWWTWDAKLTLTLVMWFIYASYLMLRAYGPKGSQGARYGAVLALIGALDAPIIYFAAELWRTAHPELVVGPAADSGAMDPTMRTALLVGFLAFTVLYVYMLIERYALKRTEAGIDDLYQHIS